MLRSKKVPVRHLQIVWLYFMVSVALCHNGSFIVCTTSKWYFFMQKIMTGRLKCSAKCYHNQRDIFHTIYYYIYKYKWWFFILILYDAFIIAAKIVYSVSCAMLYSGMQCYYHWLWRFLCEFFFPTLFSWSCLLWL